jgi:hypothetical protein
LNGNNFGETFYQDNDRMRTFQTVIGQNMDTSFRASKISGSGNIHRKELWLNVRDVSGPEESTGMISGAINDWKDYVSVR